MTVLLALPGPAKTLQNGAGFSRKTQIHYACRKGKGGLSAAKQTVGKEAAAAFAKKKSNSH